MRNKSYFDNHCNFTFHQGNCWSVDKSIFTDINVYFYDGNHSEECQYRAFTEYNKVLSNTFITIVDDWSWVDVQKGTRKAFKDLNYKVLYDRELITGDISWHNGIYVALVEKPNE